MILLVAAAIAIVAAISVMVRLLQPNASLDDETLWVMALEHAQNGEGVRALQLAFQVRDPDIRETALQCVADVMVEHGNHQIAIQAIRSLPDPYLRILYFAKIVKAGKLPRPEMEALAMEAEGDAKKVKNRWQSRFAIELVCRIWMNLGKTERAWELAQQIPQSQRRHALMGELAALFASQGNLQRALNIAAQLPDKWAEEDKRAERLPFPHQFQVARGLSKILATRQEVLKAVAEELAKQGKFDEAMKIAQTLENEAVRTEVLSALADAQERIGMPPVVTSVAEKTLKFAEGLERHFGAHGLMRTITQPIEEAVKLSKALNEARKLPDAWIKVQRLSQIAMLLASQNRREEAVAVLSKAMGYITKIKSPQAKLNALWEVALCWEHLGEYEKAKKLQDEHRKLLMRFLEVQGTKARIKAKPKR